MNNLKIGADPELFVTDRGAITHGIGLVDGYKRFPERLGCGSVQVDNVLLEYNIPPATTEDEFVQYNMQMLHDLRRRIQSVAPTTDLTVRASHVYSLDYLRELGDEAMTLGCDPDFNVYTGERNPRPNPNTGLRTAAGHLHISADWDHSEQQQDMVRVLDSTIGLQSVSLDDDARRRELYGKAGAHRMTKYGRGVVGVEYRVLSNFWLGDESLMRKVYRAVVRAADLVINPDYMQRIADLQDDIQDAINHSDALAAEQVLCFLEDSVCSGQT